VFHSFGNLLINSAVANDGTINVFDITDPASPLPLGTFEVDDESQGFSFQIESSKIKGKVISIKYEGGDKSSFGSRSMVLDVEDATEIEVEEMNSESTVQSEIILTRLKNESVTKEDLKIRFKKLHEQKEKLLDDMKELGLSLDALHEYLKDEKKIRLIETIAEVWASGVDEKDDDIRKSAFDSFKEVANDEAPELVKNARLFCEGNYSRFFSPTEGSFKLLVSAMTEGIQQNYSAKEVEFGVGKDSEEINKLIAPVLEKFKILSENFKDAQVFSFTVIGDGVNETCKIRSKKVTSDIVACEGLDCSGSTLDANKSESSDTKKIGSI
jgi:DNA-binding transcriptional regulator YhcF (GntR family)